MALSRVVLFMVLMLFVASFVPSSHARKLLTTEENKKKVPSPEEDRLYRTALPKGTVTPSSPSNKGHSTIVDEKLIARHLAAIDRILRSVPSPGVGH